MKQVILCIFLLLSSIQARSETFKIKLIKQDLNQLNQYTLEISDTKIIAETNKVGITDFFCTPKKLIEFNPTELTMIKEISHRFLTKKKLDRPTHRPHLFQITVNDHLLDQESAYSETLFEMIKNTCQN